MSNGDAQSAVRQDILEADARALESTIRAQIAAPWTRFRFGENVPVPKFHFKVEPPEDEKATADKNLVKAQTIQTLAAAGYKADTAAVSKIFGLPLTYEAPQQGGLDGSALALSDKSDKSDRSDKPDLSDALEAWLGPVADGIAAVTALSDEELDRELRNNLPEIERKASEADLEGLQQLMAGDMRRRYENQV